ncbi:hypothetical protein ACKI10_18010 [Streptomyces galilaeus]|uniref:hypothetical protein n=1 Tax=Streptomyces galilaeus TaxID=33899 RepID=UPI0038F6294F
MPEEIVTPAADADPGTVPTPQGTGEGVPQAAAGNEADPEGAEALGEPGKRALDAMKSKWQTERDQRRDLERQLAEATAPKVAEGDQPDPDAIRAEAAREATAKANKRILRSEIKAAAARKLNDPADALAHLDLDAFEVDANGDVDATEISDAIEDLLTRKPYLAATSRPRFEGTADGGASRKPAGPTQLTRADLKGMSADQIVKAKREGRLKNLLSGN